MASRFTLRGDGSTPRRGRRRRSRKSWRSVLSGLKSWPILALFSFVLACFLFGGGPGKLGIGFFLIALTGLTLLLGAVYQGWFARFQQLPLIVRLAIACVVALPFVQLVPLPPALWQALPGHGLRAEILTEFGLGDAWMPLSLSFADTAYIAAMALCCLGLFVAVLAIEADWLKNLLWFIVGLIGLAAIVGVFQFATNGEVFAFHAYAHKGALIGFYANKNHMGLTLAASIPLLFVLRERWLREHAHSVGLVILAGLLALALLIATNSRAGLGLGFLAYILLLLRLYPARRKIVLIVTGAALFLLFIAATFVPAIQDIFARVGQSGDDLRGDFLEYSIPLMWDYGAFGAGLGSFEQVFPPAEQLDWVKPTYLNHVHNDYVELVIEAGVPGVLVLLLCFAALGAALWHFFRASSASRADRNRILAYGWAGFVIVLLFALHSVVDYPVRRMASLMLLTVACGLAFRPLLDPVNDAAGRVKRR